MLKLKSLLVVFLLFTPITTVFAAEQTASIQVDGLSCPLCVYGLEKKLKEVQGVKKVETNLKTGRAIITFTDDMPVNNQTLRQAVKKAGFTAGDITRP